MWYNIIKVLIPSTLIGTVTEVFRRSSSWDGFLPRYNEVTALQTQEFNTTSLLPSIITWNSLLYVFSS